MLRRFRVLGLAVIAGMLAMAGCTSTAPTAKEGDAVKPEPGKRLTIGLMPKAVGIPYFTAMETGAKEAAAEMGIDLVYDGPVDADTAKQVAILESWIARKFDAIIVSPNDPDGIAPVLQKAKARGIRVLTADADANAADREFFVSQASDAAIAKSLVDSMAKGIGEDGKFIILTGSLTAANQNNWIAEMEKYRAATYPNMKNLSATPKTSEEDQALATQVTIDTLKAYPDLQGIFAITSVALPGAAEALRKENAASRIFLTGLSTPDTMRAYVKDGTVKEFTLWNPIDLGYLAVASAKGVVEGTLKPDVTEFEAGRIGKVEVKDGIVLLGTPTIFDKANIDKFNF